MKRVLLLATTTGYQTRAFGEAAQRLGVELVFATDRCDRIDDPWQDGAIPIRFHEEDRSVGAIVDAARRRPIDGLLVVGDRPTVIGARVAEALGLPGHPPAAAAIARHKLRTRERLRDAGMLVPWFQTFRLDQSRIPSEPRAPSGRRAPTEPRAPSPESRLFPCVLKPVALSGSRGVMRADDEPSLQAAIERLRALVAAPTVRGERDPAHDHAIVEGFIPGREYAVEGVMDHGRLQVLAIFDKPDPLDGPFFEETIYLTPSAASDAEQRAIVDAIASAAAAIGLHHGPIHAECRVNADGVFVLEVAARPIGGICASALRFVDGAGSLLTLEELLLRHAMGEDPARWTRERDASGVMMIPIPKRGMLRGVDGVEAAKAVRHVSDVRITAKIDQMLLPLPEGASYLGFIFARAAEAADVDRALRRAHERLEFRIDAGLPVLTGGQIQYNHRHG